MMAAGEKAGRGGARRRLYPQDERFHLIPLRLTQAEWEAVEAAAKAEDMIPTTWIRRLLTRAVGLEPPAARRGAAARQKSGITAVRVPDAEWQAFRDAALSEKLKVATWAQRLVGYALGFGLDGVRATEE